MTKQLFRKALAAVALLGIMASAQAQTTYITQNQTISGMVLNVSNTVRITNNATLTITGNSNILMGNGCMIEVDNGSSLIIDNSTIESENDQTLWKGIRTKSGSTVEMKNGAKIKKARSGIKTKWEDDNMWLYTGGVLKIKDSQFVDCYQGIEFLNDVSNGGYIKNTSFSIGNTYFWAHLTAYQSTVPTIQGCVFTNTTTNMDRPAIITDRSSLTVTDYTYFNGLMNVTARPVFQGFGTAIQFNDNKTHTLSISNADFMSNGIAVLAEQSGYTSVLQSNFTVSGSNETDCRYRFGICLNECNHYSIENNYITKNPSSAILSSTGIKIKHDVYIGTGYTNYIRTNSFYNMSYGVEVSGNNLTNLSGVNYPNPDPGLQIRCNIFNNCSYAIYNNGKIGNPQGSSNGAAGNNFTSNTLDIYNNDVNPLTYYYKGTVPTTSYVTLFSTPNISCSNTPGGGGGVSSAGWEGIDLYGAYMALKQGLDDIEDESEKAEIRVVMSGIAHDALVGIYSRMEDGNKLDSLGLWYSSIDGVDAKYTLVEVLKEQKDYEAADALLKGMKSDFDFSEYGQKEYNTCVEINKLQAKMRRDGRDWHNMNPSDRNSLETIAEKGEGRYKTMAENILKFFESSQEHSPAKDFNYCSYPTYKVVDEDIVLEFGYIDGVNPCNFLPDYYPTVVNYICSMSNDTIMVQGTRPSGEGVHVIFWPRYGGGFAIGAYEFDTLHDFGNGQYYEDIHPMDDRTCVSIDLKFELDTTDVAQISPYCMDFGPHDGILDLQCKGAVKVNNHWHGPADFDSDGFPLANWGINGEARLKVSWNSKQNGPREHHFVIVFDHSLNPDMIPPINSVGEHGGGSLLQARPNPTSGVFRIDTERDSEVRVYNATGQCVAALRGGDGETTIDISGLPAGIYLYTVTGSECRSGKVMKR